MRNIIVAISLIIAFTGCAKKEVGAVSFNVTTADSVYNVGDSVVFSLAGNPDYIVFYSGENGQQYQYRSRTNAVGTPFLNFLSYEQYGTHTNTLHLLVSSDFDGKFDSTNVKSANWTDITSRAKLSTGKDSTFSGNISLSDFISQDTPIYVAFKFADQQDGTISQRTWTIKNLSLVNQLQDSSTSKLLDIPNSAWLGVNILNPLAVWAITTNSLKITGGNATSASNEDWVISQPVNLTKVNPDAGVSIKTLTDPVLKSYYHIFKNPGNYTIVFDAINANSNSSAEGIKKINIRIK